MLQPQLLLLGMPCNCYVDNSTALGEAHATVVVATVDHIVVEVGFVPVAVAENTAQGQMHSSEASSRPCSFGW